MKFFRKTIIVFFSIILGCAIFIAYFYFTLDKVDVDRDMKFGTTFTPWRATDLGLDWREAYVAILDDLGARRLRLAAYWNRIEKTEGEYDFSELDWMIGEAEKRNADIILAIGARLPGWPECHIPDWARESFFSGDSFVRLWSEKSLLRYLRTTVERYRESPAIWAWQVENEPFLKFGECPSFDREFLGNEIELVRAVDGRPIILTASGEFGKWRKVAPLGDIFGTTLYRSVYHHLFGYITYPIPPSFFRLKSLTIKKWTKPENIIVIELQGEPWVEDPPISDAPLEEQYITMSPEKFNGVLEYIRYTDFNEFYFWGSEWWYWMKQEGRPEIWNIARNIFAE